MAKLIQFPAKLTRHRFVLYVGLTLLIAVVVLVRVFASSSPVAFEAETGTIVGGASSVALAGASGGSAVRFSASGSAATTYSVSGNTIRDGNNQPVTLHGVDRPSLEWDCNGQAVTGAAEGVPASDFATMRNTWNANAVRIALNQDFWLTSSSHYCSSYKATVDAAVQAARANNLIVILDLHWSDQGNLALATPGQQCMADQNSLTFWQQVATIYKSNPNIWFELYNEPHDVTWSVWQNGGSTCGFQAVGMQQLYASVRSTGATNMVIAGGNNWASNLSGAPMLAGTNIAYAIHPYAADISGGQADNWSTGDWDNRFGNLATTVPVIATEFGDSHCGSTYDQGILDYFRAHHIGYTGWAWFAGGCGFPSLITNAAGTCVPTMGCVVQADMKRY